MIPRPLACCALAAVSSLISQSAAAQTTVFLIPDRDNSMFEEGSLSNGQGSRMFIGFRLGDDIRRALVHFNVAQLVPAGSQITAASLDVTVDMSQSGTLNADLHRVTADWGEGTSIAPGGQGGGTAPTTGDCTWDESFFGVTSWMTPGGDFDPQVSASVMLPDTGMHTFASTPTLVADVQSWLDTPANNFGWIIRGDETAMVGRTAKALTTRESYAPSVLSITYIPPASATSFGNGCIGSGSTPFTMTAQGVPSLGNTSFRLDLSGGTTGTLQSPALLFSSSGLVAPIPLFGCEFWINPAGVFATGPVDANLGLTIPISNDPGLLGLNLAVQGAAIDSVIVSVILSNAVALAIGS